MKTKIERDNELKIAYSYITMAKIALVDASDTESDELQNIIERLSDVQVRLAPMTVKKV